MKNTEIHVSVGIHSKNMLTDKGKLHNAMDSPGSFMSFKTHM